MELFCVVGEISERSYNTKNAPRGSHCGGEGVCRLRDAPQAENPAVQDSLYVIEEISELSYNTKIAPRGSYFAEKDDDKGE